LEGKVVGKREGERGEEAKEGGADPHFATPSAVTGSDNSTNSVKALKVG